MSDALLKFLSGVLILAIIAVIVSKNSRAAQVVQAMSSAFTNILGVVVAPVSGGGTGADPDVVVVPGDDKDAKANKTAETN